MTNHHATETLRAGATLGRAMRIGLVAIAALATALPAAAGIQASQLLQVEASDSSAYVTRALRNGSATVPHRPETDIDFPRR